MAIKSGDKIGKPSLPVKTLTRFAQGKIQAPSFRESNMDPIFDSSALPYWDEIIQATGGFMAIKGVHELYMDFSASNQFGSRIEATYKDADRGGIDQKIEVWNKSIQSPKNSGCGYITDIINLTLPIRSGSKFLARIKVQTDLQSTGSCIIPDKGRHYAEFTYYIDIET